jgi:hypothetical protein
MRSNSVVVITFPFQLVKHGKGREFNPPFEYCFCKHMKCYRNLPSSARANNCIEIASRRYFWR